MLQRSSRPSAARLSLPRLFSKKTLDSSYVGKDIEGMDNAKDYSKMTDSELVCAVLAAYAMKQCELAAMLLISESRISNVLHERTTLRPLVRRRLEDMLDLRDRQGIY